MIRPLYLVTFPTELVVEAWGMPRWKIGQILQWVKDKGVDVGPTAYYITESRPTPYAKDGPRMMAALEAFKAQEDAQEKAQEGAQKKLVTIPESTKEAKGKKDAEEAAKAAVE